MTNAVIPWLDVWNGQEPTEPVGAIFTKPEIVSLILNLADYVPEKSRLAGQKLLEPSCGDGAFLREIIRRLIASERIHQPSLDWQDDALGQAITATDLNLGFVALAREQAAEVLRAEGCPGIQAILLAERWIHHADFLLSSWPTKFDLVVGNPPYVRIEDLPGQVLSRYRELYPTCGDRADLYVAFFENGLQLLSDTGRLAFISANRFAKNLYGRGLRQLISREFHVRYFLNLEHTQPFLSDVSAYPAITVIDRQRGAHTWAATLTEIDGASLDSIKNTDDTGAASSVAKFPSWYADGAPWVATERKSHDLMASLNERLPLLEDSAADTRVGIGLATGADRIFVSKGLVASVEPECQMPLVMAADIRPDAVTWSGHYLVNPFDSADDGRLRSFDEFPGMAAYFERHRETLMKRHVAQKRIENWFRTIDRVTAALLPRPKLLVPDIQSGRVVGMDSGRYYPHHNVYWVTSQGWNLRVLQALLRSRCVLEQVRALSVQMRGGSIRYQAQVLRKLRLPSAESISDSLRYKLEQSADTDDLVALDLLTDEAFLGHPRSH